MPARAVKDEEDQKMIRGIIFPTQDGMGSGCDGARDFDEVGRHRLGVDGGQDQACGNASCRTDRAEDIRPLIARIAGCAGSGAAPGPDPGQCALLANARVCRENHPPDGFLARLTLEPDFEGSALRSLGDRHLYRRAKVFLNASCASGSVFGCCGRTESLR